MPGLFFARMQIEVYRRRKVSQFLHVRRDIPCSNKPVTRRHPEQSEGSSKGPKQLPILKQFFLTGKNSSGHTASDLYFARSNRISVFIATGTPPGLKQFFLRKKTRREASRRLFLKSQINAKKPIVHAPARLGYAPIRASLCLAA